MKKIVLLMIGLFAFYQSSKSQCTASYQAVVGSNGVVTFVVGNFTPQTSNPMFSWNLGNGLMLPSNGTSYTYQYANNGTYTVCVSIIDSASGCSANNNSWCDSVTVTNAGSGTNCTSTISYTNSGNTFYFTPVASGGTPPYTYQWTIIDSISGQVLYSGNAVNPSIIMANNSYAVATLTCTDSLGCTSSNTQFVGLNWNPSASCNASFVIWPDSLNTHQYSGYNYSVGTNLHYFWNWGDGSSDTIPYPSHTYSIAGFYNVCLSVWSMGGGTTCSDSVCINYFINRMDATKSMHGINILNKTTGINKVETAKSLIVFPNPASTELTINVKGEKIESLKVISISGQLLLQNNSNSSKINISELTSNIYFIEAKTSAGIYRTKFVKE